MQNLTGSWTGSYGILQNLVQDLIRSCTGSYTEQPLMTFQQHLAACKSMISCNSHIFSFFSLAPPLVSVIWETELFRPCNEDAWVIFRPQSMLVSCHAPEVMFWEVMLLAEGREPLARRKSLRTFSKLLNDLTLKISKRQDNQNKLLRAEGKYVDV